VGGVMKKMLALGMIVIVAAFSVAPAFADELSAGQEALQFRALLALPGEVAALTDEQLSAVEGTGVCVVCLNFAKIRQTNVAVGSIYTFQGNSASVWQRNN
jgi:hypothetical protein